MIGSLIAGNLGETQAEKKFCDRGACILVGCVEYAGRERGLTKVFDSPCSHLAFKARIDRDKNTCPAFVDMSTGVVEMDRKDLGRRQMNANCAV